ncbi:DUF4190 domain-containing protein [Streptomyces kebangsaanensis]|uniref:DUF4190 domain-containing protein n=1 Tax=Streptomyces kebangsaanensis TaxID=864058 RepID=UPI0009A0E7A9|nr:DUF4190 domain-containing protein [Streptomyces kebangsaanensis]
MSIPPPPPPPPPPPSYPYQPPVPPPGPGQQWGPTRPPVRPVLNGLAVAALVTSLLCLAPLGLILGVVALVQISRKGQRGKGLAIAGISVSGAVLLLAAAVVAGVLNFRVWTISARDDNGEVPGRGWSTVHLLKVGDCFNPGAELPKWDRPPLGASVEMVPCDESHRGEAYATFALSEQRDFPGRDAIGAIAGPQCTELLFDYSVDPVAFGYLRTYYYYPDERGWAAGKRTVLCWAALFDGAELDTSVRRGASDLSTDQLAFVSAVKPLTVTSALQPVNDPRQDLAGAKAWAGQMAEAQAETIQLLKDAELPGAERPVEQLVAELEAGLPLLRQAAEARDADTFHGHLRSLEQHNPTQHVRRIRGLLDLPQPSTEPTPALRGTAGG